MQERGEGAGTATVAAPLVHLAAGDLHDEVQCPACGWCSRWHAVHDDVPTVPGPTCPRCAVSWQVEAGRPAPDVQVDARGDRRNR